MSTGRREAANERGARLPAVAWAFLKRDALIATSYKAAFATQALGVLFKVITFYYISAVFGGLMSPKLAAYGNDYFAYLMIGVALMDFMYTSLETFDNNIRESQMMGTLEIVLLSPIKLTHMLLFSSLWPYLFTTLTFLIYLFFGVVLFDLDIGEGNPVTAGLFLLLSIAAFAPIGIMSATVVLVWKRGAGLRRVVSAASALLGGAFYPADVLPDWIAGLCWYIPMTHAVEGMRGALLQSAPPSALLEHAWFLCVFAALAFPLSLMLFKLGVDHTKRTGTLTQY
ncbi:MAG: ABC transporter permease [Gammaproteobacteria bacterium]